MPARAPRRSLRVLRNGAGAFAAVSVYRPRRSSSAWPAVRWLAQWTPPAGAELLVGLRDDIAREWLGWHDLPTHQTLPRPATTGAAYRFPSTQGGLLLQLGAPDRDALGDALRALDDALAPHCWKDEEVAGGWSAEHREPFGFRERSVSTPEAVQAATIQSGPGEGGAWVLYLRFEAERARFLAHAQRERERIVGASLDGVPIATAPEDAHVRVVRPWAARLLRRGFPYRASGIEGLAFLAAARSPIVFEGALDSLVGTHGPADRLMPYAPAVSGGVYFVPPDLEVAR